MCHLKRNQSVVEFVSHVNYISTHECIVPTVTNAEHTLYGTKRLIGRGFADDEIKEIQKMVPFKIVKVSSNLFRCL